MRVTIRGMSRRTAARVGSLGAGLLLALAAAGALPMPAAAAAEPACPNASFVGFKPFLADCGAFERVSPRFQAGGTLEPQAISSDGSRVVIESIAVFAGDEGYGEAASAVYESVRSVAGWATSAISPPSALFPAQKFLDFNPDLERGLWLAHLPSQALNAEDLYLREPGGAFVKVGPIVPPYATEGPPGGTTPVLNEASVTRYAGASTDLSHVFFSIGNDGPLWPGDTTAVGGGGQRSLYEYAGTGNSTPMLVGVDETGRLISDCGTSLGALGRSTTYSANVRNAISANGETVFFTPVPAGESGCEAPHAPAVAELYARLGVGAGATTADISEPSASDCSECQTSTRTTAEFQGASRDGKRVFFLSEQELFTGVTGMNLYEYDFNGPEGHRLLRVASASTEPHVLSVSCISSDGSHVYFTAEGVLTGANREGRSPSSAPGAQNMYVFERDARYPAGRLAFIGTPTSTGGAEVTPDGRFLVFQASGELTKRDTTGVPQVFEYGAASEELVRVSVGEPGYSAGMESADARGGGMVSPGVAGQDRASLGFFSLDISDDGSVVTFFSLGGLTRTAAAAGAADRTSLYEYRNSGVLSDGEVSSASNGSGLFDESPVGMDRSGSDIFFVTPAQVLPGGSDGPEALYDVRVGGGFPPAPGLADCEPTLSCQGVATAAPGLAGAATMLSPSGGNLPSPPASAPSSGSSSASAVQRLAKRLRSCRRSHRPGRKRRACEAAARKRFAGVNAKSKR